MKEVQVIGRKVRAILLRYIWTTFAVRQIEIGLAGFASMLFGITVAVYGMAFMVDRRFPIWLGALGLRVDSRWQGRVC